MNIVSVPQRKGFTLLEILLVIAAIGILAAIVLVAINPTRQLAQARNAQRRADVLTISNAINQYLIANSGNLPTGITTTPKNIINTTATPTSCTTRSVVSTASFTASNGGTPSTGTVASGSTYGLSPTLDIVNLTAIANSGNLPTGLSPDYVASIPRDPQSATTGAEVGCTDYIVQAGDVTNSRTTVFAPRAELSTVISVTR
jgi:prepilin-type N-terminal cleavage/methylation domain-containing protein